MSQDENEKEAKNVGEYLNSYLSIIQRERKLSSLGSFSFSTWHKNSYSQKQTELLSIPECVQKPSMDLTKIFFVVHAHNSDFVQIATVNNKFVVDPDRKSFVNFKGKVVQDSSGEFHRLGRCFVDWAIAG